MTPLNPSPEDAKAAGKVTTIRVSQTELCDGWQKECLELRATNAALIALRDELAELLALLYDKWENGDPCYQNGDVDCDSLGNAFKLSDEEENRVLAALKATLVADTSCADKAGGV